MLGNDGGAVCEDPNGALARATLLSQLSTGASGPGATADHLRQPGRPGSAAIIKVYCPDELDEFQEFVDDLKLDDDVAGC